MESNNDNEESIKYFNFNEDGSCITIGTKNGFKIITCNPFTNYFSRKFGRGVGIIEMYHSSNILAITGCEKNSEFPSNKLVIWDENKHQIIREIRFSLKIGIIKIIKNILFIVNDIKILILNFESLSLIDSLEIYHSEKELISFSVKKNIIIAYINKNKRKIYIKNIDTKKKITIEKIDNELPFTNLQFNQKGDILAAASKGKVILYNSLDGKKTREIKNDNLKNGKINNICFSENDKYIALSTIDNNSARINIFDIWTKKETNFLDYIINNEEKCFAYYKFNASEFLFRFDNDDKIFIITNNGNFIKINMNKKNGGFCKGIENKKIFN